MGITDDLFSSGVSPAATPLSPLADSLATVGLVTCAVLLVPPAAPLWLDCVVAFVAAVLALSISLLPVD